MRSAAYSIRRMLGRPRTGIPAAGAGGGAHVADKGVPSKNSSPAIAFFFGGFNPVGGIESLFEDLLTNLEGWAPRRYLFVWGKQGAALRAIEATGTTVVRSALARGCRFGVPDICLLLRASGALRSAHVIIMGKLPFSPILKLMLLLVRHGGGIRPRLVFITPYRPAELWGDRMPDPARHGLDLIIVQSTSFRNDLRRMGFVGRTEVLPYIPPAARLIVKSNRTFPDDHIRLGFLGRLVKQKNLGYLFRILDHVHSDRFELHIFGSGDEEQYLRQMATQRAFRTIFHGHVHRNQVSAAIDACDAFVNPSLTEGQCLVALEVLSRGKPFVGTPVGAVPEILGNSRFGHVLPLDDEIGAAEVITGLMQELRRGEWNERDLIRSYQRLFPRGEIIERYKMIIAELICPSDT
jgi:glycosyltransferase involved in cell wall biosynthesis